MSPGLCRRFASEGGMMFIALKPRRTNAATGAANYRPSARKTGKETGGELLPDGGTGSGVGGRQSNASYQYTLLSDDLAALREWEPKIRKKLATLPELADVNSGSSRITARRWISITRRHGTGWESTYKPPTVC
ncbi:hypothetical protein ACLK1S_12955 [Escherichia coli]